MPTITRPSTTVHEIAAGIYRISTPVPPEAMPGGFTFNQFLVVDDEPLLFHTGMRTLFPAVREAVARVIDPARLRWIGFSHIEADESGALNDWLAVAPQAQPVCSQVAAMTSADIADRPPRALADGEELSLGARKRLRWLDAPHLPHNWECGYMFESSTRTLLCGDLFTHGGHDLPPITETEVLSPAEAMRKAMPASVAIEVHARAILNKLAATEPRTLALMHGS
jgi:flavorubredoxin